MRRSKEGSGRRIAGILALLGLLILGACASVDETAIQKNIANAELAINDAQRRDARQYAPLEMRIAEEKLESARLAFEKEEFQKADWQAEEALADAQVAEAKARAAKSRDAANKLRETVNTLEQEILQPQQPSGQEGGMQ